MLVGVLFEFGEYLYNYFSRLSKEDAEYLNQNFPFYRKLPDKSKEIFRKRIAQFLQTKEFVGRNNLGVTHEMKLLIGASATQLTFGFRGINMMYFKYILLYPDVYYNSITENYHKGEVNPRAKAIVLSWKYFLEGYSKADGRNLGLHEMAHALKLEDKVRNKEYNFLNKKILKKWELATTQTMEQIRRGEEDFFRKYGAENKEEFFAVAVENFFERPVLFQQKHPILYGTLCKLLNQNPAILEKNL